MKEMKENVFGFGKNVNGRERESEREISRIIQTLYIYFFSLNLALLLELLYFANFLIK